MPSLMNTAAPDPVLALHLLRSWMQSQADAGVPRVAMTNEARAALKHIIRTKPWKRAAGDAALPAAPERATPSARPASTTSSPSPAAAAPGEKPAPAPARKPAASSGPSLTDGLEHLRTGGVRPGTAPAARTASTSLYAAPQARSGPARPVAAAPTAAPQAPAPSGPAPVSPYTTEEKQRLLGELRERAESAPAPRALGSLRETMVFAVGNPDAPIVFVGEAPGHEEEKQREPFVGPAGELLNKIIRAMGLERSGIYISNICKFRPAIIDGGKDQGWSNRKPDANEMASCVEFVREEIRIIGPRAIVALGATAAEGLLGLTGAVSRMRHQWHGLDGIPVMVTYHPSYLLRNSDPGEKRKVWEDMLMVMERLEMPISEKQRGYFLTK